LPNCVIKYCRKKLQSPSQKIIATRHYVNVTERGLTRNWGEEVGKFSGNKYMLTLAISGQSHELWVKLSYLINRSCVHIIYHAVYIQSTHTLSPNHS